MILATISFAFLETCGTGPAIQYPCEAPWQASPAVANHHQTPLTVLAAHLNFLTYSYISLYLQLPLPPNTPSFLTIPQLIHHRHHPRRTWGKSSPPATSTTCTPAWAPRSPSSCTGCSAGRWRRCGGDGWRSGRSSHRSAGVRWEGWGKLGRIHEATSSGRWGQVVCEGSKIWG